MCFNHLTTEHRIETMKAFSLDHRFSLSLYLITQCKCSSSMNVKMTHASDRWFSSQVVRIGVYFNHLTTEQWDETMKALSLDHTVTYLISPYIWYPSLQRNCCSSNIKGTFHDGSLLIKSFLPAYIPAPLTRLRMLPMIITQQQEIPEYLDRVKQLALTFVHSFSQLFFFP